MASPGPMYNQIVLSCWTCSSVEQGNSYIGIIHNGSSKKTITYIYGNKQVMSYQDTFFPKKKTYDAFKKPLRLEQINRSAGNIMSSWGISRLDRKQLPATSRGRSRQWPVDTISACKLRRKKRLDARTHPKDCSQTFGSQAHGSHWPHRAVDDVQSAMGSNPCMQIVWFRSRSWA